jgi:acetylcholinesterase
MVKLFGAVALLGAVAHAQNTTSLPEVDLGYEIYRAASFNVRSTTQ